MARISRSMKEIGFFLALNANYVGAYVLTIVWKLDPLYYALIVLVSSFLFGAVVVDLTKSTVYTSVSIFLGAALATGLLSAPSLIFAESETLTIVLTILVRYLLISLIVSIFGMLIGCIVGDMLLSNKEMHERNRD